MQPTRNNDVRALYQAAATGDVATLLLLISQDSRVLDKSIAQSCCTPLHIAAKLGHLEFVKAVLERKPGFVGIQDFEGSTPLHLAVANGHVEVAKAFLEVDAEISLAKDCRGRNPLHISIMRGEFHELLQALVDAKPEAALALTDDGENILHLCVTNSRFRALCFLVESVEGMNSLEFMNTRNSDGFTALHLAVIEKQTEIVKYLLEKIVVEINKPTARGCTPDDSVEAERRRNATNIDIIDILQYNGTVSSQNCSPVPSVHHDRVNAQTERKKTTNANMEWVEKKRNALMVVASLIATMAYQAGTNPPVTIWQDPKVKNIWDPGFFMFYNTMGFLASLLVILLLISGLPFTRRAFMWILIFFMWVAIIAMIWAYTSFFYILVTAKYMTLPWVGGLGILFTVWTWPVYLLLFGHIIRKVIRFMKKKKASSPTPSRDPNAAV